MTPSIEHYLHDALEYTPKRSCIRHPHGYEVVTRVDRPVDPSRRRQLSIILKGTRAKVTDNLWVGMAG